MAKPYRKPAKSAHARADTGVGKSRHACRLNAAENAVALDLWPHKTAANWAAHAGVAVRRAEDWLAGRRAIGDEARLAMLRGEHGLRFLEAMMAGSAPAWWRGFKRQIAIVEIKRAQQAAARRLAALEAGAIDDLDFDDVATAPRRRGGSS